MTDCCAKIRQKKQLNVYIIKSLYFCTVKNIFNILNYDKISSTNDEAKILLQKIKLPEFTIISAKEQTIGRGQRENIWFSESDRNLLISIITYTKRLKAHEQFYLSKVISLGIIEYLETKKNGFTIKWPNDIYFENKKICGILIENTLSGTKIKNSVIGIGLNINQKKFPDFLPDAISLTDITKKTYDLKKELHILLNYIFENYQNLEFENFDTIDKKYHNCMYKMNKISEFKDTNGIFKGKITGTLPEGKLIIQTSEGILQYYNFKEVEFL